MLKRIDDIEIPAENPFANDLLDRKTIAENLATLLENTSTPYVMSISAPWGQGKTTFIRMWQQLLENRGFATAYFDAWSTDYANDPLLAFIGSIEASISASDSKATQALNGVKNALKKVIQASPKIALNWALRGGLHYLTDGDSNAKDEIEALSEIGAQLVDKEMAQQLSVRKVLDAFSEKLSELGQTLGDDGKPLIILIDELDRCRPDYAIELLERIKHLFTAPNILIVISTDIDKLGQSAAKVIGFSSAHSDGYVRRFIDLDYRLQLPKLNSFLESHLDKSDLPDGYAWRDLYKWMACIARLRSLSTRDCIQIISRFSATAKSFPNYIDGIKRFLPIVILEAHHDYVGLVEIFKSREAARERLNNLKFWRDAIDKDRDYDEWYSRDWIFTMYAAWFFDSTDGVIDESEKEEVARWSTSISHHRSLIHVRDVLLEVISYGKEFS